MIETPENWLGTNEPYEPFGPKLEWPEPESLWRLNPESPGVKDIVTAKFKDGEVWSVDKPPKRFLLGRGALILLVGVNKSGLRGRKWVSSYSCMEQSFARIFLILAAGMNCLRKHCD